MVLRQQLFHAGTVEKVGVVNQLEVERLALFEQVEVEVDLGFHVAEILQIDRQPRQVEVHFRQVRVVEHHLEDRGGRRAAFGLQLMKQLFERQILMFGGFDQAPAYLVEKFVEGLLPLDLGADHQGIEEKAHHVFELAAQTSGHRGADEDFGLAGLALEEELIGRHQQGEKRRLPFGSQVAQLAAKPFGQGVFEHASRPAVALEARPVGGQCQDGSSAGELFFPVGELAVELFSLQGFALPLRKIGVLQLRFRQRGGLAGGEVDQQGAQLAEEDAGGPAVENDVVETEEKARLLFVQQQQPGPHQRSGGQIEGGHQFGVVAGNRGGPHRLRQAPEVDHFELEGGLLNDLVGEAFLAAEKSAQRFMAADQLGQSAVQGGHFERAAQTQHEGHVEGIAAGPPLVEQPHTLLAERKGQPGASPVLEAPNGLPGGAAGGAFGRGRLPADVVEVLLQAGAKTFEARRVEKQLKWKVDAEQIGKAGAHAGGDQRMATQGEELVVAADYFDLKQFGPDRGHLLLEAGKGCFETLARRCPFGLGQGSAIGFAVGCKWDAVQKYGGRRHHVVRQLFAQRFENRLFGRGIFEIAVGGDQVGDQPFGTGFVFAQHHDGFGNARMQHQGVFDFRQLDAETAQLDLVIGAADEFDVEVFGLKTHEVASEIKAAAAVLVAGNEA